MPLLSKNGYTLHGWNNVHEWKKLESRRARKLQFCIKNVQEVIKIYCILLWLVGKHKGTSGKSVNVQRIVRRGIVMWVCG